MRKKTATLKGKGAERWLHSLTNNTKDFRGQQWHHFPRIRIRAEDFQHFSSTNHNKLYKECREEGGENVGSAKD